LNKKYSFVLSKIWFEPICFSGSLAVWKERGFAAHLSESREAGRGLKNVRAIFKILRRFFLDINILIDVEIIF